MIVTKSQFKFWNLYLDDAGQFDFQKWKSVFEEEVHGYERTFNVAKYADAPEDLRNTSLLSYQPLQTVRFTPEEAEQNVNSEEVLELPESEETENAKENESAEEVETEKTEATQENISEPEELSSEEPETKESKDISDDLKTEIKSVLSYMDQLLENLPENKIAEFAQSEQFDTYKKLFKELGLA